MPPLQQTSSGGQLLGPTSGSPGFLWAVDGNGNLKPQNVASMERSQAWVQDSTAGAIRPSTSPSASDPNWSVSEDGDDVILRPRA
jgi:hypothetical protein